MYESGVTRMWKARCDFLLHHNFITRCSAIAERPRCSVRYSFRRKYIEDSNWETVFYGHGSIFNHYDIIGLKICRIP